MLKRVLRSAFLLVGASLLVMACGSGGGSGGGANDALFSSTLMFVGTQLHIYGNGLADFNGDGLDDTAFSAQGAVNNQYVTLLYAQRGSSRQGIEEPIQIGEGQYVGHGDFNADGIDDVVSIIDTPGDIDDLAIHFGRVDGTFDAAVRIAIPTTDDIRDSAIGDVNGDGAADVVMHIVDASYNHHLMTLLNSGDGLSFADLEFQSSDPIVGQLVVEDVNGDGFDDLIDNIQPFILIPHTATVARVVKISDGTGGYGEWIPVVFEQFFIFAGYLNALPTPYDFTGDDGLDFVANIRGNFIDVYEANEDGSFFGPIATQLPGSPISTVSLLVFDANDDGALDVVFRRTDVGNTLSTHLALGNGDGTFGEMIQIPCGDEIIFGVSDVNQDGILDILTTAPGLTSMRNVYFGNGLGNFSAEQPEPLPVTLAIQMVHAAGTAIGGIDVDGDGNMDLATIAEHEDSLSILFGHGSNTFEPEMVVPIDRPVTPVDLDGDGALDFLGLDSLQGYVSILRNYGGRDLRALPPIQLSGQVLLTSTAEDIDSDGNMDIVVTQPDATVGIAYGAGNLQFDPVEFVAGEPDHHYTYTEDINGDGYTDFVSFEGPWSAPFPINPATFSVIPGGPGRTTGARVQSTVQTDIESSFGGGVVAFGDLNGDGRTDAVVGDRPSGSVLRSRMQIFFGQPDSTFALQQGLLFPCRLTYPRLADLDLDGDLDLVVFAFHAQFLELGPGNLYVYTCLNDGNGMFTAGSAEFLSYFLHTEDWTAEVLDVTGDDIPDAVAHFPVLGFTVATGLADGTFEQPHYFAANAFGYPVAADFDHDGDTDFAALEHLRMSIGLFFNRTFRE